MSRVSNRSINNQSRNDSVIGALVQADYQDIHLEVESDLSLDERELIDTFKAINERNQEMDDEV